MIVQLILAEDGNQSKYFTVDDCFGFWLWDDFAVEMGNERCHNFHLPGTVQYV
jgi:hypothetical protein